MSIENVTYRNIEVFKEAIIVDNPGRIAYFIKALAGKTIKSYNVTNSKRVNNKIISKLVLTLDDIVLIIKNEQYTDNLCSIFHIDKESLLDNGEIYGCNVDYSSVIKTADCDGSYYNSDDYVYTIKVFGGDVKLKIFNHRVNSKAKPVTLEIYTKNGRLPWMKD